MNTRWTTLVLSAAVLVASCATFPSSQLELNLANETVPVSLNALARPAGARTLSYEAGHQSATTSVSATSGGVTRTTTLTMTSDLNQPLAAQMQTLFAFAPDWAAITSFSYSVTLFNSGFLSTTSYLVDAEALVPGRK